MKPSSISSLLLTVLACASLASPALAAVSIDFVTVGNPGNAADTTSYGSVGYAYQIAKNETTISQYAAFLNAVAKTDTYGLYNTNMASDRWIAGIKRSGSSGNYSYAPVAGTENKPITYVSWFDAARFCNWMQNGQGSGSTETGAYTLLGAMSGIYTKNAGATIWIPSEDEWYKAAYYDATKGGTGGYWQYPTQSDVLAGNTIGVASSANYWIGGYKDPYLALTDVGAYGDNSDSFYGTNDQGGNVVEWTDVVMYSLYRATRGGCFGTDAFKLLSGTREGGAPTNEMVDVGFRIATVPEPSCMILTILASGLLVTRRKR